MEEELYINEQNIPVLKVSWQKEVYGKNELSDEDKIISLTVNGYDEYAIDASENQEHLDILDGLGEQLDRLTNHGTEKEKRIAKQLVDNFATEPIY